MDVGAQSGVVSLANVQWCNYSIYVISRIERAVECPHSIFEPLMKKFKASQWISFWIGEHCFKICKLPCRHVGGRGGGGGGRDVLEGEGGGSDEGGGGVGWDPPPPRLSQ